MVHIGVTSKLAAAARDGAASTSTSSQPRITFSGSWPSLTHPVIDKVHAAMVIFFVAHLGWTGANLLEV